MKPALEAAKNYLKSKRIRYESITANSLWFSLLVPTPETRETPNRIVSCGISIPENDETMLNFTATVMAVEVSEENTADISTALIKFQSSELKSGKIVLHPEGTILYHLTQFLCSGGTTDERAIGSMIATAVLEIASIFMLRDNAVKIMPLATVTRFGMA